MVAAKAWEVEAEGVEGFHSEGPRSMEVAEVEVAFSRQLEYQGSRVWVEERLYVVEEA